MAGPTSEELEKHPPIGEHDPVPRVPRPKGLRLPPGQVVRIAMFASLLVGVIMLREPCSAGVGSFVNAFEDVSDAGAGTATRSTRPRVDYVRISADDDPETVRKKIDKIRGVTPDAGAPSTPDAAPSTPK